MNAPSEKYAVSYIRYSTPEQARGDSYRRQYVQTQEYCLRKGLTIIEGGSYFDSGVSAFHGANKTTGQLARLLSDVREGRIPKGTRLIVESLDRLGRDGVTSQMGFFLSLLQEGLIVVTLGGGETEYSIDCDFTGLMYALVNMSRANEDSSIRSHRKLKSWEEKRKRISEVPLTSIVPYWLLKQGDKIVVRPERAETVKDIFEMALNGLGKGAIAQSLNASGVPVWGSPGRNRSGLWNKSYIAKILENRAVIGEYQPHIKKGTKRIPIGEAAKDYFPLVISEDLFLAVRQKIASRVRRGGRATPKVGNLFSGRLKCLSCGSSLHYENKGAGKKVKISKWLACERRGALVNPCFSKRFPYDPVEHSILGEMVQIDWDALLEGGQRSKQLLPSDHAASLREKIKVDSAKIENLLDVIADGTVSAAITDKLVGLEKGLSATRAELQTFEDRLEVNNRQRRMAVESAGSINNFLPLAQDPHRRQLLKRHVDDLLRKTYVSGGAEGMKLALFFHGGGFSYKSEGVNFRFEKDVESPQGSQPLYSYDDGGELHREEPEDLMVILDPLLGAEALSKLQRWEPSLAGRGTPLVEGK